MEKNSWNAETYSQFIDLRTRPAKDLLAAIPDTVQPNIIYDLGCGTGNSTILLKERWPTAKVYGLDSSDKMLQRARENYTSIQFLQSNIEEFNPEQKIDLIFSNAALHWLPKHDVIIPCIIQHLNVGGIFAAQIPNNFHMPSHQAIIQILQKNKAWEHLLNTLKYGELTSTRYQCSWYYDFLTQHGLTNLHLWETTYYQDMENHQAIFDWMKATSLRAILAAMSDKDKHTFEKAYIAAISHAYPTQANGHVLFSFRRLFMVGQR